MELFLIPLLFFIGFVLLVPVVYADLYYEVKEKESDGKLIWERLEYLKSQTDGLNDTLKQIHDLEKEYYEILEFLVEHGVGIRDAFDNNPDYWITYYESPLPEYAKGYPVIVLNMFVDEFHYPDPKNDWYYNMTFTQNVTGTVVVKIPNNMKIVENMHHGHTWVLSEPVFDRDRDSYRYMEDYRGACYDTHVLKPYWEYSVLEVDAAYVLGGNFVPISYETALFCYDIFKNPPQLRNCNITNQNHINVRGESVCVSSVEKLIDRGYLI